VLKVPVEKQTVSGKDLLIKVEKADARIESIGAKITDIFNHFSQINEEIGEIRSMVIERERGVLEMQTGFEKMRDDVSKAEPGKVASRMDSFDQTILEVSARAEKTEAMIGELKTGFMEFKEKLKGIQSTENLLDLLKDLDEKTKSVTESSNHSERMAAKAEKMFLEIDKRLPEMESTMDKMNDITGMMNQMVRDIDAMKIDLKTSVHKEDLKKIWNEIDDIKGVKPKIETSVTEIPEAGKSAEISIPAVEEEVPEIVEIPRPVEKTKKDDQIPKMLEEAYGYLKLGGKTTKPWKSIRT
jgi:methyl-accepting chemotaxis protein